MVRNTPRMVAVIPAADKVSTKPIFSPPIFRKFSVPPVIEFREFENKIEIKRRGET
jgi:hypothetical protein